MTCCSAPLKETSGLGVLHVLLLVPAKKYQQKQSAKWNWNNAKSLFLSIPGTGVDIDLHACKEDEHPQDFNHSMISMGFLPCRSSALANHADAKLICIGFSTSH